MTIYIDDSGTSPENAVAVTAGWIAHTDSWVGFQTDWDKARDIDGDKFESMHMAEFVFGRKATEFEGWSLEKKQRISARLRGIIKKTAAKGFALGIVEKDFDELVPNALQVQGFESHYTCHSPCASGKQRPSRCRVSNSRLSQQFPPQSAIDLVQQFDRLHAARWIFIRYLELRP